MLLSFIPFLTHHPSTPLILKNFPELSPCMTMNLTQHNHKYSTPSHLQFLRAITANPQPGIPHFLSLGSSAAKSHHSHTSLCHTLTTSQTDSPCPCFKECFFPCICIYCTDQITDFSEKCHVSDKSIGSAWHDPLLLHLLGVYLQVLHYFVLQICQCHPQLRLD